MPYGTILYRESPEPTTSALWRYLDIPRFLDLVQKESLWFPVVDRLRDKHEATLPAAALAQYRIVGEFLIRLGTMLENELGCDPYAILERALEGGPGEYRQLCHLSLDLVVGGKGFTDNREDGAAFKERGERLSREGGDFPGKSNQIVNCWHINQDESAAMWDLYGSRIGAGVAIKSSLSRLCGSFQYPIHSDRSYLLLAAPVNYSDFSAPASAVRISNSCHFHLLPPCFFKWKSFEHEREFRIWTTFRNEDSSKPGLHLKVDLNRLIECVYVHPEAEAWMEQVVEEELRHRGFGIPVIQSALYSLS